MCPGVGKTYRMLQEGHAAVAVGRDVTVGLLETHGRADIKALAEGLEVTPLRDITYRDITMQELDVAGVLARRPALCLIDELAHTNVPGSKHKKRSDDIEDILAEGIDVISTVNVQHLESLNDSIAELSGVRQRETVPDNVLDQADEVVIVDLTAVALIDRLRAGKVYPMDRVAAALNNFFKIENLTTLREIALREVAEEVETKRLNYEPTIRYGTREDLVVADAPAAVNENLLALVKPQAEASRLVRRAWRTARRYGTKLTLLWVKQPNGKLTDEETGILHNLLELSTLLGVQLLIKESDNLFEKTVEVAHEHNITYILMGVPSEPRGLKRFRKPLSQRLVHALPGVDIRMIAPRMQKNVGASAAAPADGNGETKAKRGKTGATATKPTAKPDDAVRRILLPFAGSAIPRRSFDAAVRLAKAENATIMPAFLAIVPVQMALDMPLREQGSEGMLLLEAIEQRALAQGARVDTRISRGRTYRRALQNLLTEEAFDRVIISADDLTPDTRTADMNWLCTQIDAEVLVLKTASTDTRTVTA